MKSKYTLKNTDCCYAYISKDLKKEIEKHKNRIQKEENKKNGRKAKVVTFSYASKDYIKYKGGRKWF